jgi:hypothetical protein
VCATCGESDSVGFALQLACPIGMGCSWHVRCTMCVSLREQRGAALVSVAHMATFLPGSRAVVAELGDCRLAVGYLPTERL